MTTDRTRTLASRVAPEIRARGGVAPVRALLDAGHSKHAIATAVSAGSVQRVRQGWVSVTNADELLLLAARRGVVLTCSTQARRLGLWVLEDDGHHFGAAPHARIGPGTGRIHWSAPPLPRHPGALIDPIENVLAIVADCLPHEQALAIWESALRQQLVERESLARLPLRPAARRLLDEASSYADSGLESFVPPRLRWLRLPIRSQSWILGHRVDFLIGARLVLQIDGGHHVGLQREADIAHDALLMLHGYHVIRVGYTQVVSDWPAVQEVIQRAVAQGLHRAR